MQKTNFPRLIIHYTIIVLAGLIGVVIASAVTQVLIGLPKGEAQPNILFSILVVAAIEAVVLQYLALRIVGNKWQRWLVIFAIHHSTKSALMLIEALFYLNLWNEPPLLSIRDILAFEVLGVISSAIVCGAAAFLVAMPSGNVILPKPNPIKMLKVAALYAVCYLSAGAFIFMPLAGSSYAVTYEHLVVPWWMPLLQIARGFVWAYLLWLLVSNTGQRVKASAVGMSLAVFSAAQLLIPSDLMPNELRSAHIVEMAVSMFIFGYLAVLILLQKRAFQPEQSP